MTEKPQLIIKRYDSYELHFDKHVDFVSLTGEKLGSSLVHKVN